MKNLEIKSKYPAHKFAEAAAKKLGAKYKGILSQTDTYFNAVTGRLKMRVINNKTYELIHYHRANTKRERFCSYERLVLNNGRSILEILKNSLGIKCVIVKKRILYIYKNIRIHLDTVNYLGKFLEFEVVCKTTEDIKNSRAEMKYLTEIFRLNNRDIVPYSYSDLLLKKNRK
jgi:predicted adenylyl cyclase CyaB